MGCLLSRHGLFVVFVGPSRAVCDVYWTLMAVCYLCWAVMGGLIYLLGLHGLFVCWAVTGCVLYLRALIGCCIYWAIMCCLLCLLGCHWMDSLLYLFEPSWAVCCFR